ncbi:FAD-dependent oxidoreductase [Glutamicibacter sp.]|uniref:FAD-dependent oxidoreductase n=1 Tax=Glutamicibacter sp. TaxID=1931995 RepID=UPI002B462F2F|nr:NAD(P)/FAD-dependent oxidoreductase [Glutamicibacter sp.]HJX80086.1 NAD(P)/FAD-dependent oxidoreductase [Glutamicibacter sp.]
MQSDIAIIGAGPVGLTLAILLIKRGHRVQVFEKRQEIAEHSRAIGLHPPALEVLHEAGIAQQLTHQGLQIRKGVGVFTRGQRAALGFARIPGDYPYVLALPQRQTQLLLRERLAELAPQALQLGCRFQHVLGQGTDSVHFTVQHSNAEPQVHGARWLIGADGVDSAVRRALAVPWRGRALPDAYRMGDYPDASGLGETAVLYLHPSGIVESFPLPGEQRRWVAHRDRSQSLSLEELVHRRTGHRLAQHSRTMHSDFTTAQFAVPNMVHGRTILIGDAAHQISPIGGQGLALGLLDAGALAGVLNSGCSRHKLADFEQTRLSAARLASRRAHLNMMLGRPMAQWLSGPRDAVFSRILANQEVHDSVARIFTMTDRTMRAQTHRQHPVDT